jgi:Ion channel
MSHPKFMFAAAVSAAVAGDMLHHAAAAAEEHVAAIETAASYDAWQFPVLQRLEMPAVELLFGGIMLILIMLTHAAGVSRATTLVLRRSSVLMAHPTRWRADLLMSRTVFALLCLHLLEIGAWSLALFFSGLVTEWRAAAFFAGNTYTTVGYGTFALPEKWKMLSPFISISGLFTFGWTASVLVDLVRRCQQIKDAAAAGRASRRAASR